MELNLTIPGVSGDTQKDIKELRNYIFQLTEQLRYVLYNMDVTNFNDLGLARYENGVMQIYTEKLQAFVKELELKISGEEDSLSALITAKAGELTALFEDEKGGLQAEYKAAVDGLSATITKKLNSVDTKVSTWQHTVDGFSSTVSEKLNGVDTKVSTWQHTVDGFSSTVSEKLNGVDTKVSTWQHTVDGFSQQISDRFTTLEGTYVTKSAFEQTAETVNTMVTKIGEDGSKLHTQIIQDVKEDDALIQLIASKVNTDGFVTTSTFEVTADAVRAMVSEIGDDGEITAASIVAAINDASSKVVISADHIDLEGVVTFSAITEEPYGTLIDGAYICCGSGGQLIEIEEGVIRIGEAELYQDGYGIFLIDTRGGSCYITSPNGHRWELTNDGWEDTE